MKTVGVRELKDRLSEYLRVVRAGESVLVTDRGEVVAELAPPLYRRSDPSVPAGLTTLAKRGLATMGTAADVSVYKRLPRKRRGATTVQRLLDEERGSR